MAENKYFMDGVDFTEETYNAYMKKIMANDGYLVGEGSELEVIENTPAAMNVVVGTGKVWVRGVLYENTAAKTVTVDAADATHPRIDRIVVRLTWADDTVEAVYLKGTAAASPAAPALTQSSAVWELSLAQILVPVSKTSIITTDITDERDTTACGQGACRLGTAHIDADGALDMADLGIHNVAPPTADGDAVNKGYADGIGAEIGDIAFSAIVKNASYWLPFSDTPVSRTTYAALFAAVGTVFGVGDGSTTFNLPSPGRVPVAYKAGDGDFGTVGYPGGEKTHTLSVAEMPTHTHTVQGGNTGGSSGYGGSTGYSPGQTTSSAGSGTAHNILQPYQVFKGYIRYA